LVVVGDDIECVEGLAADVFVCVVQDGEEPKFYQCNQEEDR
jgi:hypothetical protein